MRRLVIPLVMSAAFASFASGQDQAETFLRLRGQDFVELQKSQGLIDLNADFTVEAWVRPGEHTKQWQCLMGDDCWRTFHKDIRVDSNCGWALRFAAPMSPGGPRKLQFLVGYTGPKAAALWFYLEANNVRCDQGVWYHFAVCREKNTLRVFVNGKPVVERDCAALRFNPTTTNFYLGVRKYALPAREFNGDYRAFRISNIARYTKNFSPPDRFEKDAATQVLFDFSKKGTDKVADLSGNGHDGIIAGAKWETGAAVVQKAPAPVRPASGLPPVPDQEKQAAALKSVRELFKAEYAKKRAADQLALADRLFKEAEQTRDDPVARYVLDEEAIRIAAEAWEVSAAMRGLEVLGKLYDIDLLRRKVELVEEVSKMPGNPTARRLLANMAARLAAEAEDVDRFDLSTRLITAGTELARKIADGTLANRFDLMEKEIIAIEEQHDKALKAMAVLQEKPGDPEASTIAGRYIALTRGRFAQGLPHLAKGTDAVLKKLATDDLARPMDPATQLALAEAWWEEAEKAKGLENQFLHWRAHYWYGQAHPNLTGLTATRVEGRLRELEKAMPERFVPRPAAMWTFEGDLRDSISGMAATPMGPAAKKFSVKGGRLQSPGNPESYLQSPPLRRDFTSRTLEAWVTVADVDQRSAGVFQIRDTDTHDGIFLGELQPRQWCNHSSFHHRSARLNAPDEDARPNQLVHLAIVYAPDHSIALYRNGKPYGEPYTPRGDDSGVQTYRAGKAVLNIGANFRGEIEEVRLYGQPLSAAEIASSFRIGPAGKK